jgi:hypothetical protein
MRFPEHELGKGTLGYKGETREYYDSKRGLWDRFRWVLAAVLIAVGVIFLIGAASPVTTAQVVSVTDHDDPAAPGTTVVVALPDGTSATVTVALTDRPAVGSGIVVTTLPGGRLSVGDHSTEGRNAGLLFVSLGLAIVAWAIYRIRRPRPEITTVLVPDDTYALP